MNIRRAFQIFDLDPKCSLEMIKKRYHELAGVWHPDLHAAHPQSSELASAKMKEINSAYETIRSYMENHVIIVCHHCGAEDRKQSDLNIDYATCSSCGKQLLKPIPRKKRVPCGNYRCAGTIGSNGRCNYCGKTIEEGRISADPTSNSHKERRTHRLFNSSAREAGNYAIFGVTFTAVILFLYYGLNEDGAHENEFPTPRPQAIIDKSTQPGLSLNPNALKPVIFKSNSQAVIADDSHYADLLNNCPIKNEEVFKLQKILGTMGYQIKKPDGLICKRTISCLKQYSIDFGYIPGENFPHCFFKHSLIHYQIASVHKDWIDIYLAKDLEGWINAQSEDYREQICQSGFDRADAAVQIVRIYKFQKFKPLPASLPETSIVKKNFGEAIGHLSIKTQRENNNYYIKLVNTKDNNETLSGFIRSGSTLDVRVPCGVYVLKYAAGPNWYGLEYLFGDRATYAKLPKPIHIAERNYNRGGLIIELIPSRYGRLTTDIISEFDF